MQLSQNPFPFERPGTFVKSIDHKYKGLFPDSDSYTFDLYVYPLSVPDYLDYCVFV